MSDFWGNLHFHSITTCVKASVAPTHYGRRPSAVHAAWVQELWSKQWEPILLAGRLLPELPGAAAAAAEQRRNPRRPRFISQFARASGGGGARARRGRRASRRPDGWRRRRRTRVACGAVCHVPSRRWLLHLRCRHTVHWNAVKTPLWKKKRHVENKQGFMTERVNKYVFD